MSQFIPIETPGGVVWVELEESANADMLELTAFQDRAFGSFQEAAQALKANAQFLQGILKELEPSGVEITFGIKVGVEGGTAFFGLAKATGEANYEVKLKWETEKKIREIGPSAETQI